MSSSPPIAKIRRWLTTTKRNRKARTHQAPIRQGSNTERTTRLEKRKSFQEDPHLAKPEPALHRLQELKSPPPIAPPSRGPDSTAFKSRPLYRRTHSSPANSAEGGTTSTPATATNLCPAASATVASAGKEYSASRLGHSHEARDDHEVDSASESRRDGGGGHCSGGRAEVSSLGGGDHPSRDGGLGGS